MLKILTYAYSQNIYFSRKIETACKSDINFMWLLAGQKAPDHSMTARFRSGFLADVCENLFYQMVKRLEDTGELSKEIYICLEKVCGEMGRENVPKGTGSHTASEQGVPAGVFVCYGNKGTGLVANRPVFRKTLSNRQHGFCSWTWKKETDGL